MIKKALVAITICAALFYASPAQAASVFVHDEYLETDQPAFIENGRTFVPMRAIFEKLGAQVNWDASTGTVSAQRGEKLVTIDKPRIVNGRTMVPLRYVSETLGSKVDWRQALQSAYVDSTPPTVYSRTVYGPQSLEMPSGMSVALYDWPPYQKLAITCTKSQGLLPQTGYGITLYRKDGEQWREISSTSIYQSGGIGDAALFKSAQKVYPALRAMNVTVRPSYYTGPMMDLLLTEAPNGIYLNYDYTMPRPQGSGYELPTMQDGVPNPPTGLYIPRSE